MPNETLSRVNNLVHAARRKYDELYAEFSELTGDRPTGFRGDIMITNSVGGLEQLEKERAKIIELQRKIDQLRAGSYLNRAEQIASELQL